MTSDRPSPDPPAIGKMATTGAPDADPERGVGPIGRHERLFLGLTLALAVALVAIDPGSYVLQTDTAELAVMGQKIAAGEVLPLTGTNVASGRAGHWLGPFAYYMSALPFFITPSVYFAALFFGGLFVVSVLLLWQSARVLFGPRVGVLAAAFYAVSAQALLEHRLMFFSALAPVFVLALLRACVAWGPERRPRALFFVVAIAGALFQLHVVHVAYFGIIAVAYYGYRTPARLRLVLRGLLVVVGLQIPWVIAQLQNGGRDIALAFAWIASRGDGSESLGVLHSLRVIATAMGAPFQLPLDFLEQQGGTITAVHQAAFAMLGVFTIAGLALGARAADDRRGVLLIAAWTSVPLCLFGLAGSGVYSFHMVSLLPAFALLAALGAERLVKRLLPRAASSTTGGALVGVFVFVGTVQAWLLVDVARGCEEQGYAGVPTSAVLSYPDALWRFPIDIRFPRLRDADDIETLLARVDLSPTVSGRVHGPIALNLSHLPPYLPTAVAEPTEPERGLPNYWLGRGAECEVLPRESRAGAYCLRPLPNAGLLEGWRVEDPSHPDAAPVRFPARSGESFRFSFDVPANTAASLVLLSLGPFAVGMDRPTPPEFVVTLHDVPLMPTSVDVDAPVFVMSEARYEIVTGQPGRLEIEARSDVRHDIDLRWDALDAPSQAEGQP